MTPPSIRIIFELEAAPRIETDWLTEGEEERIHCWLEEHDDYTRLIAEAIELTQCQRAA